MQIKDPLPESDNEKVSGRTIRARNTFHKSERLCSRKIISGLIDKGNSFYTGTFKVLWSECALNSGFPVQVAFSVTKNTFRLAVKRNLIKRRIREAYRKHKQPLYEFLERENIQIALLIIFRRNEVPDYSEIERSVIDMRDRLIVRVRELSVKC